MKLHPIVSKFLTNKWVLNIVAFIALLNVFGYMVIGNFNNVVYFIVLAILVRYFSKNMIIVLGVPILLVNLYSMINGLYIMEGLENNSDSDTHKKIISKINDDKRKEGSATLPGTDDTTDSDVVSSNIKSDEHFEVGRPKNKSSKIDYASTIESAYDDLNNIIGGDGIKRLTSDTQNLMKQQLELAKSMEAMTPLIQGIMPMAEKAQEMMASMDTNGAGLGGIMDLAKKLSGGNNATPAAQMKQ